MSFLSHLECSKCKAVLDADSVQTVCACGSPLLVRYDLGEAARNVSPKELEKRAADMWRYRELLPVRDAKHVLSMGEGWTPVWRAQRLGKQLGFADLWVKDEGLNPTGTFKARGAAAAISRARELGIRILAMPTAGNAGSTWALYCARAGMEAVVVMPSDAEPLAMRECVLAGARTYLVRGLVSDAASMISRVAKRYGWFEVTTLKEPYRLEGKKTMGYEIAEQFGWRLPDAILCPTGGGVSIIAIYKAMCEMLEMGWISGKFPKLIAVQSAGCSPIVKAFHEGKTESVFFEGAQTIAGGIRVPKAFGDFLVLDAVRQTGGTCVAVTDENIFAGIELMGRLEGSFVCPEGAALVSAAKKLRDEGFLKTSDRVVLLNTGTGLKYPDLIRTGDLPLFAPNDELPRH
jgi:threonine synthase